MWILLCFLYITFPLSAQEVLRGEVKIELEQIRGFSIEENKKSRILEINEARAMALEEAARYFGAMVYGWSFRYEVGERARNIEEKLELTPLGMVSTDDPRLVVTDVQLKETNLYLWSDYRPGETQLYRLSKWKAGTVRTVQGYGQSSLEDKYAALEDAARAALRAMLRGSERNRPKEVTGYISLAAFPRYWMEKGRWAAMGRFRAEIQEIQPFAAY
jgi:hypothetical protein